MKKKYQLIPIQQWIYVVIIMMTLISCKDILDSSIANSVFGLTALKYEFILALVSLISGYTMIIAGIVFIALGLNGNIEWVVESTNFQSRLLNAGPGLVLSIVGALLVWRSRMNVKVTKDKENNN